MTTSDALADFLLARITEDQAVALLADWEEERSGLTGNITTDQADDPRLVRTRHFSTQRLRTEATVRRHLVEMHRPARDDCLAIGDGQEPCPTLRLLALPYADHPDYRPEWRP